MLIPIEATYDTTSGKPVLVSQVLKEIPDEVFTGLFVKKYSDECRSRENDKIAKAYMPYAT